MNLHGHYFIFCVFYDNAIFKPFIKLETSFKEIVYFLTILPILLTIFCISYIIEIPQFGNIIIKTKGDLFINMN